MNNITIGIDLGTSNSVISIFENNHIEIIPNSQGIQKIPNFISFDEIECIIGEDAYNQIGLNPNNTVFDIKKLLGKRFSDEEVQANMKYWPFKVVNKNGLPVVQVEFKDKKLELSAETLTALILSNLRQIAEDYLDTKVNSAVITIPSYFDQFQKQATIDAAHIAGLNVLKIINEPEAVGLAYGLYGISEPKKTLLVFGLGASKLDISILTIENGYSKVITSIGDISLGGDNFTNKLVNHFTREFKKKYKLDISSNSRAINRLKYESEKVKRLLSSQLKSKLQLDSLCNGISFYTSISRVKFEEICQDFFKSIVVLVDNILNRSRIDKSKIDEVILVGASTRIPYIQKLLSNYFDGKKLNKSINPDEVVAYGAGIQAALLANSKFAMNANSDRLILPNVTSLSLGVETNGYQMLPIISTNTHLPIKKTKIFTTTYDYQTSIKIRVFQGERPTTRDNYLIGEFLLSGIIPKPARVAQIEVTFHLNQKGNLKVTARDKLTGKSNQLKVSRNKSRLSTIDYERMIFESEVLKNEDQLTKNRLNTRKTLESNALNIKNYMKYHDFELDSRKFSESRISRKCGEIANWLNIDSYFDNNSSKKRAKNKDNLMNLALIDYMMSFHNNSQLGDCDTL